MKKSLLDVDNSRLKLGNKNENGIKSLFENYKSEYYLFDMGELY